MQPFIYLSHSGADREQLEAVRAALRAAAIPYVDRDDVAERDRPRTIAAAALFVACFSSSAGFAAEDMECAFDELRALRRTRSWLVPLKLTPCTLPSLRITETITLADLNDQAIDARHASEIAERLQSPSQAESVIRSRVEADLVRSAGDVDLSGARIDGPFHGSIDSSVKVGQAVSDHKAVVSGVQISGRKKGERV